MSSKLPNPCPNGLIKPQASPAPPPPRSAENWRPHLPNPSTTVDETITILRAGSKVRLAGDIDGIVVAIEIRGSVVSYQVAWWNGRTRQSEYVGECEVVADSGQPRIRVGFQG